MCGLTSVLAREASTWTLRTLRSSDRCTRRTSRGIGTTSNVASLTVVCGIDSRGNQHLGPEEVASYFQGWLASSSDESLEATGFYDAGTTVVVEGVMRGTNDGPLGTFPPTGRKFELPYCEVFQSGGRAREPLSGLRRFHEPVGTAWPSILNEAAAPDLPDLGAQHGAAAQTNTRPREKPVPDPRDRLAFLEEAQPASGCPLTVSRCKCSNAL